MAALSANVWLASRECKQRIYADVGVISMNIHERGRAWLVDVVITIIHINKYDLDRCNWSHLHSLCSDWLHSNVARAVIKWYIFIGHPRSSAIVPDHTRWQHDRRISLTAFSIDKRWDRYVHVHQSRWSTLTMMWFAGWCCLRRCVRIANFELFVVIHLECWHSWILTFLN